MAVLGRTLFSSAERLDLSDLLSIESYVATDFRYIVQALAGFDKPYVLRGFDVINPSDSIGGQNISIRVADSVVFFPMAVAGSFYTGLPEGSPESQPLTPDLKKGTLLAPVTNYVYLTFTTVDTAQDTRAFWDPDKESGTGGEFTNDVNTESVLQVVVNVSTSAFPSDGIPICKVVMGATSIQSIQDCRDLFFRLGTGGASPDPLRSFEFRGLPADPYKRAEPLGTISSSTGANPFQGADKNIYNLKEWMDVVMTKLRELGGTSYWYEDASAYSIINMFKDTAAMSVRSKGKWILDDAVAGQLSWTENVTVKNVADPRDVVIVGPGSKILGDQQVMFLSLRRAAPINVLVAPVYWTQGQNYINGDVMFFANLSKGDWIKPASLPDYCHLRVEEFFLGLNGSGGVASPSTAKSIVVSSTWTGPSADYLSMFTKGVYQQSDISVADRNDPALTAAGGNLFWLAMRSDTIQSLSSVSSVAMQGTIAGDGQRAKFITSQAHGLADGDRFTVVGTADFDGTHVAQVEDANVVYFDHATAALNTGANAYYALATTASRNTPYGLQLESASHCFEDESSIVVAGTSSAYDGTWKIKVRNATQFTFPVPSLIAAVSTGSATLIGTNVRTEAGAGRIARGESREIGDVDAPNLLSFLGMTSSEQIHPTYATPSSYGALHGSANFNSLETDTVTDRLSKLTAMMADRSQDRETLLAAENVDTVTNVASGTARVLSFSGGGPKLTVSMGGAPGGRVYLSGSLSLEEDQVAYFPVDRNADFSVVGLGSLSVTDVGSLPVTESIVVFAERLSGDKIYLWDGRQIGDGTFALRQDLSAEVRSRLGVIDATTLESYGPVSSFSAGDTYPAALTKLDSNISDILSDVAVEETQTVGPGGTNTFVASTINWNPSNALWDIVVTVNGVKQTLDTNGGLAKDFRKLSSTALEFAEVQPELADITVRVESLLATAVETGFFHVDVTGSGGLAAYPGARYNTGTDRLQAFRNGVGMVHSTAIGQPIDRYTEATKSSVTLGAACAPSERLSFVNLTADPDFRSFDSGLSGLTIAVPFHAVNTGRLIVLRNGLLMWTAALGGSQDRYTEASPVSIALEQAAEPSEVFTFLHLSSPPLARADVDNVSGATIPVGFSYEPGGKLLVFRNGVLMANSVTVGAAVEQYQETSSTEITLQQAATVGEVFSFIKLG